MDLEDRDQMCFACGKKNTQGLQLEFTEADGAYQTVFTPSRYHQGYPDILHGGLTSTLLDEVMGRCLFAKGILAPTAQLEVRFKKPIPVQKPLTVKGWMVTEKGRVIEMAAEALLEDGTVAAEAKGKFVRVKALKTS